MWSIILIGLAIAAAIAIVTTVAVIAWKKSNVLVAEHGEGRVELPLFVPTSGENEKIRIVLPTPYSYDDFVLLHGDLSKKTGDRTKYNPAFVRKLMACLFILQIYAQAKKERVDVSGEMIPTARAFWEAHVGRTNSRFADDFYFPTRAQYDEAVARVVA